MARGPATFKQADLVRAVKAARTCHLNVVRTEISPDGKIILHHCDSAEPLNELDAWKAKRDARSTQGH